MRKTKLLALALAVALLCSGCFTIREVESVPAETPLAISPVLKNEAPPAEIRYSELEYVHYELDTFSAKVDTLRALLEGDDAQAALELYDVLYDEYAMLITNDTLAYLIYCENVLDTAAQEEMLYADEVVYEVDDLFRAVTRDALNSRFEKEFSAHIGAGYIEELEAYEDISERELELNREITELTNRYNEQMLGDSIFYEKDGVKWTYTMLQSDALYQLDYGDLYEVYYGLMGLLNEAVGETYLELVTLRQELAALNGYDNFLDYAYEMVYGRDYTPGYARELHEAVKTHIAPRFYELTDENSELLYATLSFAPTEARLLSLLRSGISELPEPVTEALDYMERCELLYFTTDSSASPGAFTTTLEQYHAPFMYISSTNSLYDLQTIYHEFGHYLSGYYNRSGNLLGDFMSLDVAEIHSTGMEMLMISKYGDVFADADEAQAAAFQHWYSLLSTLISGCIEDEFQQYVYTTTDELTVERLNEKYCEIYKSYGYDYGYNETSDTDWMLIPHTFESPLYYISYAMSVMPTFDLWYTAETDRDAAIETYLSIVSAGCYNVRYLDLLDACGIRTFRDEAYFGSLCDALLDNMERIAEGA